MRISQLSTLAKTSVTSSDFLVTANNTNSANQKIAIEALFPTLANSAATSNTSLLSAVSNKNEYTISRIVAGSTKLTVTGGGGTNDVSIDLGTLNFSDLVGSVSNTQLLGNIDLTSKVTGTLPTSSGGTGSTATTYCNLTSNVTGTLPIANGGTGLTSYTADRILYASSTSVISQLAAATNGQILIGSTGTIPAWGTLTSTDGSIAISNGAGTIGLTVTSIPSLNSNVEFTAGSDRYVRPAETTGAADKLYVRGGASTTGAGGDLYLEGGDTSHAGSNSGKVIVSTGTGSTTTTATPLKIKDNKVCITNGTTDRTPDCSLHVYSKAGTGKPGIRVEQLDTDEPFIRFEGTTASDQGSSLSTDTSVGALTGHIRVSVNGADMWIPYYIPN